MGAKPKARKATSKAKKPKKEDQKAQSERFIEAARNLGVDESGKEFNNAMRKLVRPKKKS